MAPCGGCHAVDLRSRNITRQPADRLSRADSFLHAVHVSARLHALSAAHHFDLLPLLLCYRHHGITHTALLDQHGRSCDHNACRCAIDHCRSWMAPFERDGSVSERFHSVLLGRSHMVDSAVVSTGLLAACLQKVSVEV